MTNPLLVLDVHLEVADHDDPAVGPDALFSAAELGGLHVALYDVDAVLLVEGDTGDLVEANDIVLADESRWPVALFTNMRATVALPPEMRWAYGETCWKRYQSRMASGGA